MWTDDRVSDLKRWVSEGLTSGQIAKLFGGVFSRSAITGKTHRLGINFLGKPVAVPKAHQEKARKPQAVAPASTEAPRAHYGAKDTHAPTYQTKPLLQRVWGRECGYIVSGEGADSMACGAKIWDGGSANHVYCRDHWNRCYTPAPKSVKRRGSW